MFHTMINNENRKQYASYFFANFLNKDYEEIYKTLKFVKTELDKDIDSEREKRVDFICKLDNEYVLLEMNNRSSSSVLERNLDYAGKIYGNKRERINKYEYNKVISININNFNFKGNDEVVQRFLIKKDDGSDVYFTDKIQIYNIYLPLIKEKYYNKEKLSKFEEILLIFNENDKELHDMMIQNNMIDEAKEKGIKTGIETGKKMGIETEKIEIAKNLLKENVDINTISKCTGLSLEEIQNL